MLRISVAALRALLASSCCALIALAFALACAAAPAAAAPARSDAIALAAGPGDRAGSGAAASPLASAAAAGRAPARARAERAALKALGAARGSEPLIVFRGGRPLPPGTRIASAGLERLPKALARSARTRAELLDAAGVQIVRAPLVARVGSEPAWFFYADEAPFQAYQHRGRVVLVGARSGKVAVSRRFSWPPLLNGQLPYFLRSYAGYRNPRARAFARLWTPKTATRAKGRAAQTPDGAAAVRAGASTATTAFGSAAPLASAAALLGPLAAAAQTTAPTPAQRRVATALADEGACTIRVGDTLGNFFDASSFDRTRSLFGGFFNELAQADGRFVSARYRVTTGTTLRRYVERLIAQQGCRELLLYVAGGGYLKGEPAISVGIKGRRDGRVEQQLVTAASLRALIAANPGARFHLLLDAPGAGGFLTRLSDLPNLKLFLASARAGQASFTALPGLVALDGGQLGNDYNRDGLLEFSNRGLTGLRCFRDDADEVTAALNAKAQGMTPSILAWMMRRAYAVCGEGSLVDQVADAPRPQLETPGYSVVPPAAVPPVPTPPGPKPPVAPDPDPPLPPGPKNVAPTAAPVAVETEEDTPVAVTLLGADPDGDALAYATAAPVPGGAVTGDGAQRTFTPAPDFAGTATFAYTVSDGRESATATVTVTVTPVDDPPAVDPGAGTADYADGEPPVAVAPALTVTDVDSAQLDGATVAISAGYEDGGDRLAFTDQNGISGDWDTATATLTLSGAASLADYQAALRTVAFDTPLAAPSEAPRTLTFVVENGAPSAPATRGLTVDHRQPPVLGGSGPDAAYTEGDPAVALAPWITVADPDSARLASATVRFAGGSYVAGEDELTFAALGGIAGSFDAVTGTLTLTGPATGADWQAALRTVGYRNGSDDPSPAQRSVAFQISDGMRVSGTVSATAGITAVNDLPRLRAGGGTPAYTEGDATGVVVDPALEAADPDDATLSGASVTISGGRDAAGDELLFTNQSGITGSWNAASGRLTLTGSATVADYQAALRSVRFRSTSDAPAAGARTISFAAADATGSGSAVTTTVAFTPVDDAPTVTTSGGAAKWTGSDLAVDGALTVADVDSVQLTGATVRISGGYVASADELVFTTQNGISGSWDALTGTLTLTGAATLADWQSALRTVAYRHTGPLLDAGQRTISFAVSNALGSAAATKAVVFGDAPQVTLPAGGLAYTENDAPTAIEPAATVTDADDARLDGATVAIGAGHAAGEDVLSATTAGTAITATFDAVTGTLELTGEDTVAHYQQVLRTVAYANTSENPSTATRTLEYAASDGVLSGSDATTVTVTAVDDPPVVTTSAGTVEYVEDDATGVVVDPGLTVSDVDSTSLTGAAVVITHRVPDEDRLTFADQNGIAGSWSPGSGTLTLTGAATVAEYQAALRSVRYVNDEPLAPSALPRAVSFAASDGSGTGAPSSRNLRVTAVNDAPWITSGATLAYTENDPASAIDPALTLTDGDSATLVGATVTLGAGHAAGEDVLGFVNQNGITGSFDSATGRLTLSGSASVSWYRDALRSVTYVNSSEDPSEADRTVTFTVDDGGAVNRTASATATIEVTNVNDAPVVPDATASAVGNTPLFANTTAPAGIAAKTTTGAAANVLTGATDVDGPGPLRVDVAASATSGDRGGTVAWSADGGYAYRPAAGFTGSERVAFVVTDQGSPARTTSATLTVTVASRVFYVSNQAAPGGDGRAETPFATLAAADSAANATGDTVYVFAGDGGSTGLGGGIALLDGQRLLGEGEELVVGGSTLLPERPTAGPSLDGTIALASGNTVMGLAVLATDPGAAAMEGGAGDSGGRLARLDLASDAGDALRLVGTSGTWSVESVRATTNGGTGIVLTNAGAVDFVASNSVQAHASAGIAFRGTRTSGEIGAVVVDTAGRQTGIAVTDGTGSLDVPMLVLQTGGAGIALANSEGIQIGRSSPSTVTAGETAVTTSSNRALTSPPRIELQSATSTGGTHGLRLGGLGTTGSFRAPAGTLSGQTVSALTVDGGAGTVAYGGTIGNGSGLSAQVLNRTGGSVTVGGPVTDGADSGGGIAVTGSSGGTTTFSGATTLATGAEAAVRFTGSSGHALAFTSGALDLATTTGAGFEATGGGTVTVTGGDNVIVSGNGGTAARIAGTTIAAAGVSFRSIAQYGGANAIVLDGTGTTGAFRVTGIGTSSGSGGLIQNTTGAAVLVDDASAQLANQTILAAGDDGIRISADSGAPTVSITDADIDSSAGDHIQVTSGSGSTATPTVTVDRASLTGPAAGGFGGGVVVNPGGTGNWNVTVQNSVVIGADGDAITVDTPGSLSDPQPVTVRATLLGNTIGAAGFARSGAWSGSGIAVRSNGNATVRTRIANNTLLHYATNGVALVQNDGRGALHATVDSNTVANPDGGGGPVDGIVAVAGGAAPDDGGTLCVDVGRQVPNTLTSAAAGGGYAIWLRQRDLSTVQLPTYAGAPRDSAAIQAHLLRYQPGLSMLASPAAGTGGGFVNAPAGCTAP